MSSIQQQYESLPYPHYVHPLTDPARLAAVGKILGMRPADPNAARVLDVGCGSATNLLAMAARLPGSQFLGIDFSGPDIAGARRRRGGGPRQHRTPPSRFDGLRTGGR